MWIDRLAALRLSALLRAFPAVLVTGPRQVGKTALARRLLPDANYISLDLPGTAGAAETRPDAFLAALKGTAVLDEVQHAPSLFRALKASIDADRRPGRFLLTGSQTFPLMQGVSESLAGRCGILELQPLSWFEVRRARPDVEPSRYIADGGYPQLYAEPVPVAEWYGAYVATYLERDVRNVLRVGSLRDFERFLRAAAFRTGGILSYSDLARDVGIAPNTARQWLSVLSASGLVRLIEPYHRSLGKRLVKSPKLIFADTGLAAFLLGLQDWEAIARSPVAGAFWETHVINQAMRRLAAEGPPPPIWYWRTPQGAEVDLLLERGGRLVAVECKLSEHPGTDALSGIRALERFYGERAIAGSYVACTTRSAYEISPGVMAVDGSEGVFPFDRLGSR